MSRLVGLQGVSENLVRSIRRPLHAAVQYALSFAAAGVIRALGSGECSTVALAGLSGWRRRGRGGHPVEMSAGDCCCVTFAGFRTLLRAPLRPWPRRQGLVLVTAPTPGRSPRSQPGDGESVSSSFTAVRCCKAPRSNSSRAAASPHDRRLFPTSSRTPTPFCHAAPNARPDPPSSPPGHTATLASTVRLVRKSYRSACSLQCVARLRGRLVAGISILLAPSRNPNARYGRGRSSCVIAPSVHGNSSIAVCCCPMAVAGVASACGSASEDRPQFSMLVMSVVTTRRPREARTRQPSSVSCFLIA